MTLVAILVGAFLANLLGVGWYSVLAKPWQTAAGVTEEQIKGSSPLMMFAIPFGCWLLASVGLAYVFSMVSDPGMVTYIRAAVGAWLSGVLPGTILSVYFGARGRNLVWIDAGYVGSGMVIIALTQHIIN